MLNERPQRTDLPSILRLLGVEVADDASPAIPIHQIHHLRLDDSHSHGEPGHKPDDIDDIPIPEGWPEWRFLRECGTAYKGSWPKGRPRWKGWWISDTPSKVTDGDVEICRLLGQVDARLGFEPAGQDRFGPDDGGRRMWEGYELGRRQWMMMVAGCGEVEIVAVTITGVVRTEDI